MSVIRVKKNKNYTTMSNYHLRDKNLSLKAKGLLSMMLSLPDDWNYSVIGLTALCKESKNTVNSILQELEVLNYLKRQMVFNKGKISGYEYEVYEVPQYPKNEDIENEDIENQDIENEDIENQDIENRDVYKVLKKQSTKKLNIKKQSTKEINIYSPDKSDCKELVEIEAFENSGKIPPSLEEVENYCMERNNTIDAEAFIDFYTSKGWLVGKAKMKDWKAAVRTWEKNDNKFNNSNKNKKSFMDELESL